MWSVSEGELERVGGSPGNGSLQKGGQKRGSRRGNSRARMRLAGSPSPSTPPSPPPNPPAGHHATSRPHCARRLAPRPTGRAPTPPPKTKRNRRKARASLALQTHRATVMSLVPCSNMALMLVGSSFSWSAGGACAGAGADIEGDWFLKGPARARVACARAGWRGPSRDGVGERGSGRQARRARREGGSVRAWTGAVSNANSSEESERAQKSTLSFFRACVSLCFDVPVSPPERPL